jgi:MFS family permease
MQPQSTSLWRHRDFAKFWAGQTVSEFGSMLTRIALPLTALLALDSTPLEQGVLMASEACPVLLAGLFAGVWVDRLRRRPVMMAADLARAAVLLSIPLAAIAGRLTMAQLYLVSAFAALFTTFFEAAYPAYLPTLVGRERLVEGNAKLRASSAVAEMGGFASAGVLVQLLTGPIALVVDAASFVVSALSLLWIRTPESAPAPSESRANIFAEAREGLNAVWSDPTLRALVGCATTLSLAGGVFGAMYMIFAVRDLGLSPAAAGAIAACGGVGSFLGSIFAGRALRRFGAKPTLTLGFGLGGAFQSLVPLAHGSALVAGVYLIVAQVIGDGLMTMAFVNDASLRQSLVPDRLLGRISSVANVLRVVALPVGALAGGVLGQVTSPRFALAAASIAFSLSALWIALSPIRPAYEAALMERACDEAVL